jgi:hypothetical protein
MGNFGLKAVLRILAASVVATLCGYVALAQSVAPATENAATRAKAASDLLSKLDQLVEKNQQLEKQNQELVNQISELRQFLVKTSETAEHSAAKEAVSSASVAPSAAVNRPTEASSHAANPSIFTHGFQMQASTMVFPKSIQLYLGGSTLYGKYRYPFDFRAGVNYFPFHNRVIRWNTEFLYLYHSPVGYTSVPFALGGTGPVFHTNLEVAF